MKLPGGEEAIVDAQKLEFYCLNPDHPRGKHKARVFRAVLGMTAKDGDQLRAMLLRIAATEEAVFTGRDRFGDRYLIDFVLRGPAGSATVRSLWMLRHGEKAPRLTSCYVK